jgi:hypothetical protein
MFGPRRSAPESDEHGALEVLSLLLVAERD